MHYVSGRVALDGQELPIGDSRAMNTFRFKRVSIVPQFALSAMNPTRKFGNDRRGAARAQGDRARRVVLPELRRRLELVGLSEEVLGRYPIELSGGMKQRACSCSPRCSTPRCWSRTRSRRLSTSRAQQAVAETLVEFRERGFVKSMMVVTHDLAVLSQIADTILVMYAGRLAEKGPAETIISDPAAPVHAAPALLAAGGRRPLRQEEAEGHPRASAVAAQPAAGCRFRHRCPLAFENCASSRRSSRSNRHAASPAGR